MQIHAKMLRQFVIVLVLSLTTITLAACGTLVGGAAGAGGGAAVGAATGHDPGKSALIGGGIGAAAGAIYDLTR